jgi:hypothetical protein
MLVSNNHFVVFQRQLSTLKLVHTDKPLLLRASAAFVHSNQKIPSQIQLAPAISPSGRASH